MHIFNRLLHFVIPPRYWRLPVIVVLAIVVGMGILIIHISNAPSYLSNAPETCINCHVMYPQYATWAHSSHREVANCNDCHVPQDNVFRTYAFKAMDGLRHSSVFTMRAEPQVIRIKQAGINVVQENCIRCHLNMVDMISIIEVTGKNHMEGQGKRCWDCHRNVPHGEVRSLASTPHSLVPRLPSVMPEWLQNFTSK